MSASDWIELENQFGAHNYQPLDVVLVRGDGFEWNGEFYGSLSKIAGKITGAHWSGPRFFGLKPRPRPFETAGGASK